MCVCYILGSEVCRFRKGDVLIRCSAFLMFIKMFAFWCWFHLCKTVWSGISKFSSSATLDRKENCSVFSLVICFLLPVIFHILQFQFQRQITPNWFRESLLEGHFMSEYWCASTFQTFSPKTCFFQWNFPQNHEEGDLWLFIFLVGKFYCLLNFWSTIWKPTTCEISEESPCNFSFKLSYFWG